MSRTKSVSLAGHRADGSPPQIRPLTVTSKPLGGQHPQKGCTLLSRLPTELRLMIWEYTIGHQDIEIRFPQSRLSHSICHPVLWEDERPVTPVPSIPPGGSARDIVGRELQSRLHSSATLDQDHFNRISDIAKHSSPSSDPPLSKESGVGSLILTCSQVYWEAIDILYATNTFVFSEPWILPTFLACISASDAQRLMHITICLETPSTVSEGSNRGTDAPHLQDDRFKTMGLWFHIHRALRELPKLCSLRVIVREPDVALYAYSWRTCDYEAIVRQLADYFTSRARKGSRYGAIEIYVPVVRTKHLERNQVSWEKDPDNEAAIAILQKRLRSRGMRCTVHLGGLLSME